MQYTVLVLVVAATACSASIIGYGGGWEGIIDGALVGPGNLGATLKGPAAQATIVGPDGSSIVAAADSGAVVAAPVHGGVVTSAVASAVVAPVHPAVVAVPAALRAPAIVGNVGTVIDGPSGIIRTGGNPYGFIGAAPAVNLAHSAGLVAPINWGVAPHGVALGYGHGVGHGLGWGHHLW